jgi:hypothetical protein
MTSSWRRAVASLALAALGVTWVGCATSIGGGMGEAVEFRSPSPPDPDMLPLVQDVHVIGVLSTTNIAPVQGLDIQKVMGRLTDATARGLTNLPDRQILSQDEILWHYRERDLDSTAVFSDSLKASLRSELDVDAMVYITLRSLDAQMTPVSPSPYGPVNSPGLNLTVELQLQYVNLHNGERWVQEGRRSSWEPVQVDVMGGGRDPTERQMLAALAAPLRDFLRKVAPPPRRQTRRFDVSGQ